MARAPTATDAPPLDRLIWLASAVPLSRLPVVGSQVYYFPHGHAEQCPAPLPGPLPPTHLFPCTVAAVDLFADAKTDEPYATISLLPGPHRGPPPAQPESADASADPNADHADGDGAFIYFAKQLTQSDANNGGGFSVPRFCADLIFPKLDFEADPPVQKLLMQDLRGKPWEFRHIYRGTPRRHLLTTGWSKFVNAKLLVAGDTVVFMCRPDGELLVGVRRAPRYPSSLQAAGPLRNARARVLPQEVLDAARLAAEGRPFTVTYYPRQGAGEFVVPRKEVEDAINSTTWEPGVQVRMQVMEAEDSRRSDWANGTVKAVDHSIIWRMLEIDWDDSTSSSSTKSRHVNAWQVQFAACPPLLKRLRISEAIPPLCSGNGAIAERLMAPESQNMAIPLGSPVPAGMQGARHNGPTDVPSSSATIFTSQLLFPGDLQIPLSLSGGSSEIVNPENESPPNNAVNMHPSDLTDEMRSIQLFGTTITSPVRSANNDASEEENQVPNGAVDGTANEDASATSPLDWSLSKDDGHNQNDSMQEV